MDGSPTTESIYGFLHLESEIFERQRRRSSWISNTLRHSPKPAVFHLSIPKYVSLYCRFYKSIENRRGLEHHPHQGICLHHQWPLLEFRSSPALQSCHIVSRI